jgi:hypothetical protein
MSKTPARRPLTIRPLDRSGNDATARGSCGKASNGGWPTVICTCAPSGITNSIEQPFATIRWHDHAACWCKRIGPCASSWMSRRAGAAIADRRPLGDSMTSQVQQFQDVIEQGMQGQLRRRTAAPNGPVRQDKLPELLQAQFGRNAQRSHAFRHLDPQRKGSLYRNQAIAPEFHYFRTLPVDPTRVETRNNQ